MSYRIATDNDHENPNPHALDLGAESFETEEECWYLIAKEEREQREEYGEPWGSSVVLHEDHRVLSLEDVSEDPAVVEAILNIRQAIRVIAPICDDMRRFGHSQAGDMSGVQADLEQAVRFLTGQEEPS